MLRFLRWLLKKRNDCFYVQNKYMLPEPLGEEVERDLLERSINGDIESRNILIEHNLRLVVFIAKKFETTNVSIEDLISIGSIGLIKGVQTFKMDKNIKLATYSSRCIENEILMYLRKISKQKNEISLDETLNTDRDGNELLLSDVLGANDESYQGVINDEREKAMYKALDKLKPREKEIISLRFGLYGYEALTQREVAIFLGISQSYISRLEKRIIAKLKSDMEYNLQIKS